MDRPIVVPLDGSEHAARALPLAHGVAARSGASIHVVRVHRPGPAPRHRRLVGDVRSVIAKEDQRARLAANRYLDDVARWLTADLAHEDVRPALLDGPVGEALVSHAQSRNAALIVMATHRRGALGRAILGSVAEHMIRRAGIPVLIAGTRDDARPTASGRFERILVPLDGTESSAAVLEHALTLGGTDAVRYTLVRTVPPRAGAHEAGAMEPREAEEARAAAEDLRRWATALGSRGYAVDTRLVHAANPGEAILQLAGEIDADLIAMATRRRPVAARVLLGSTTTSVLKEASAPMLIYCPPEAVEPTEGDAIAPPAELAWTGVVARPS